MKISIWVLFTYSLKQSVVGTKENYPHPNCLPFSHIYYLGIRKANWNQDFLNLIILLTAERKCLYFAIMWAIEHVKWKELNLLWLTTMPPKYPSPSIIWFKWKRICRKQWGDLALNTWALQEQTVHLDSGGEEGQVLISCVVWIKP